MTAPAVAPWDPAVFEHERQLARTRRLAGLDQFPVTPQQWPMRPRIRRGCRVVYGGPLSSKYRRSPEPGGCWIWRGARNSSGYGVLKWRGRMELAHRLVYQVVTRRWLDNRQLHHVCGRKLCVNPAHLQPVRLTDHNGGW